MKKLVVPLALGLSLGMSNAPVMAKSTIGGIVFLNTYYDTKKDNLANTDTKNLTLANAGNSRLRIKWTNEDRVSMYYEFAIGSKNKVRHAYGKWDFSETGQILAGATSTPFAPLNPNVAMVHNSGQGYGSVSPARPSQMRYTYKFLNRQGALAFALVDPNKGSNPQGAVDTAATTAYASDNPAQNAISSTTIYQSSPGREQTMPRIDIGMAYRTFNWQIFPSLFYHKVDYSTGVDSLTASGVSLGLKTGMGPVTFAGEFGAGSNWGNTSMSMSGSTAGDRGTALYTGGVRDADNDNTGYWIDIGYRFTGDQTKGVVHFIYGAMTSEAKSTSTTIDAESKMMGISVPIDLPYIARGFRIRPELFRFEDTDTGSSKVDKEDTIAGVQLQFTF